MYYIMIYYILGYINLALNEKVLIMCLKVLENIVNYEYYY